MVLPFHLLARRTLLVVLTWMVARLLGPAAGLAWGEEQVPAALANPNVQSAMLNQGLVEGLTAYTSGDYAKALDCFQRAGQSLKDGAAQELQVKIALCHLLLNHADQGRALLETLRDQSAGAVGGLQADQILQRLDAAHPASPADREAVLRAEYLLSVGAFPEAQRAYTSLIDAGADPATREFARGQATVLEATTQIFYKQFYEVPALVKKNCAGFRSPYTTWSTVLTIADVANSRIDGDSINEVFSRIGEVERFVQEWSTRGFPDGSITAQYYHVLGNLGMHRLWYAVRNDSGKDYQPLMTATRGYLEKALELARQSSSPLRAGIMGDLVDVYLMASEYEAAAQLAQALYDEFPSSPLVPEVWLRMGIVHMNISNADKAIGWLSELVVRFPGTYAAIQAKALLDNLLLERSGRPVQTGPAEVPHPSGGASLAPDPNAAGAEESQKDLSISPAAGTEVPPGAAASGRWTKGPGRSGAPATGAVWVLATAALLMCLVAATYIRRVRVKPLKGGD